VAITARSVCSLRQIGVEDQAGVVAGDQLAQPGTILRRVAVGAEVAAGLAASSTSATRSPTLSQKTSVPIGDLPWPTPQQPKRAALASSGQTDPSDDAVTQRGTNSLARPARA
jgi:hypothetical protein